MKKIFLLGTSISVLLVSFLLVRNYLSEKNDIDFLEEVFNNLDHIESASYYSTIMPFAPGDTIPHFIAKRYYEVYINPSDTFVGASFIYFSGEDYSEFGSCYDGNMRTIVSRERKTIEIDSFQINPMPFRPLTAPFFTRAKRLIQYAFETEDSLLIESIDFGDSIQFSLSIYDTIVDIIGNRIIHFPSLYGSSIGEVSKYDIWVNKSDGLPYRIRRELPSQITIESIKNVKLNHLNVKNFKTKEHFPSDFKVYAYNRQKRAVPDNFEGVKASDWVLCDKDSNLISLEGLKSKVIMIQFTGVNCGPCQASIPFLKQLVTEYEAEDFDFVSIECWSQSWNALLRYQDRNDINYTLIRTSKEVSKSYQVQSVPVFFILDEKRVIRKVIRGYNRGTVDKQIRDAINELI